MGVKLYMDVHVRRAVTQGLRLRGVDVVTAQEDGTDDWDDNDLLDRATELGRLLFTQDDDLLREGKLRQVSGQMFAGVVYGHQLDVNIGQCVEDLELIAKATEPEEWINRTAWLPL